MKRLRVIREMEKDVYERKNGNVYNICTYRPEQCGIASWTEDKINYSHKVDPSFRNRVVAVNGFRNKNEYTDVVDYCIDKDVLRDYFEAADLINSSSNAQVVSIQHEFGIFGGTTIGGKPLGNYIINFMDKLKKPIVTTCHTSYEGPVENEPEGLFEARRKTLEEILKRSDKVITISNTAKNILIDKYNVAPDKLNVILHGIHEFDESPEHSKEILGLKDRFTMSMVGLVRKKRGIEYVIRSIPSVAEKYPDFLFVLAGKTHPKEMEGDREPYREFLMNEVKRLGIENNVSFVDRFLPLNSLLRYIQASDLCITPYTDPRQTSSGVLSYSAGLGKPIISTPFAYAKEILGNGRGIILPDFNNSESMSQAILNLLNNSEKISEIKNNLKPLKEEMLWDNVAKKYIEVEKSVIK